MRDGYTDGHQGAWLMTPAHLEERSLLYWNAGYQLHIHVNGDLGLDVVLDVLERRSRVADPAQRIGAADALRAVTIESAWSWQKENELGSIAPGKLASFTGVEEDPLTVEPMKLRDIPIWGTIFEGRVFPLAGRAPASAAAPEPPLPAVPGTHEPHDGHAGDPCGVARMVAQAFAAGWREAAERR